MKVSYLIDTDWVIHYLNGQTEIVQRLGSLRKEGLAINVISLAELYEGIYYSTDPASNERALSAFLTGVTVFGIEQGTCKIFGQRRGALRKQGKTISDFDLLIASTCLYHNLTLLTNNKKHYGRVEGLNILSLV